MNLIQISNKTELHNILDFVHDRVFDLSDIIFDKSKGVVTIPMTVVLDEKVEQKESFMINHWKHPIVASNLIVKNATSIDIDDKDRIGQGCINNFTCSSAEIVINNSVPVVIRIGVSSFEMALEITDNIKEMKSGFSLGF